MSERLTGSESHDFSRLWAKAYPVLSIYVTSVVQDYHAAEDIIGRVSEILIEKIDQYDKARPFEVWAIGIARYEVLSYRRDKARDRLLFDDEFLEDIGERCCKVSHELGALQWALQRCLKRITGHSSQALNLRYGENLNYSAIGKHLGMRAGAVRVMLHRTRETLRRCIDQYVSTDTLERPLQKWKNSAGE